MRCRRRGSVFWRSSTTSANAPSAFAPRPRRNSGAPQGISRRSSHCSAGRSCRTSSSLLDLPQLHAWAGDALEAFLMAVFAHHGRTPDLEYRQGPDVDLLQGWTGRGREPLRRLAELVDAGRTLFAEALRGRRPAATERVGLSASFRRAPDARRLARLGGRGGALSLLSGTAIRLAPTSCARERRKCSRRSASSHRPRRGLCPRSLASSRFSPRAAQRAMDGLPLPVVRRLGRAAGKRDRLGQDRGGAALGEPADRCRAGRRLLLRRATARGGGAAARPHAGLARRHLRQGPCRGAARRAGLLPDG